MDWHPADGKLIRRDDATGPGNVVQVSLHCEALTEVYTAFGEKGVPGERVGHRLAEEVKAFLLADVPVGPHLADQLLLWCAIAGGGAFRTVEPTMHTRTQEEVITRFLDVRVGSQRDGNGWIYRVES